MSNLKIKLTIFLLFLYQILVNKFFLEIKNYGIVLIIIISFLFFINFLLIIRFRNKLNKVQVIFLVLAIFSSLLFTQIFNSQISNQIQVIKKRFIPSKLIFLKNKISNPSLTENVFYGENIEINKIVNNLEENFKILFFLDNYKSGLFTNTGELNIKYIGDRKDSRAHFIVKKNNINQVIFSNAFSDRNIIYLNEYDNNFNFIRQKWKQDYNFDNHQWIVNYNNLLIVPGTKYKVHPIDDTNLKLNDSNFKECKGKIREDTIEIIDIENGKHLKTIKILDELFKLNKFDSKILKIDCLDPTHLTNIEVVNTVEKSSYFPNGKVGDLLVSLRELSTIILLDKDTFNIKWYLFDLTKKQFSTLITNEGNILILDNSSESIINGTSKLYSIDIKNKKIKNFYEASGSDLFDVRYRGKMQIYDKSLIISDSLNGKLLQLKCEEISTLKNCGKLKTLINFKEKFYLAEFYNLK